VDEMVMSIEERDHEVSGSGTFQLLNFKTMNLLSFQCRESTSDRQGGLETLETHTHSQSAYGKKI
jgi:hypothetical protein